MNSQQHIVAKNSVSYVSSAHLVGRAYVTKDPAAYALQNLVSFLSLRERIRLLSHVLTWPTSERRASAAMAHAIVRSAKNKHEMLEMITEKRGRQLLRLRHKELREIVAKVVFTRHLS
jgi:hypothetical protein